MLHSIEDRPLLYEETEDMLVNENSLTQHEIAYTELLSLSKDTMNTPSSNETSSPVHSKNELGTFNGVYVPCLLNIIGVILFLRLGWGIGQAGISGMLTIFVLAQIQAILTVLSASTIASNGTMQGGGSYFLISRSLGPEVGGAIGLQFYVLYAVGVSMYLVGLAEEIQQTWLQDSAYDKTTVVISIGTISLLVIVVIALIGANAFAKVNRYLFILQFTSVFVGVVFILLSTPHELKSGGSFTGISWETFQNNWLPHYTNERLVCGINEERCSLAGVYAVVFPLATGFMEGLNLSGDLKHPASSIPKGSLAAIGTACAIYVALILIFASAYTGETLRINFSFFQETSSYPHIVIFGVLVSCFSSGLGAMFGAARILQAIAHDNLFPMLKRMEQGSKVGNEPQAAVLFTAVISQAFICFGALDAIAPICTSFFCLSYAGVNLTCFLLQVTGVPNFRPTFRLHSWHLALLGFALNIGVMIYLNPVYAATSLIVLAFLVLYLNLTASPTNWGDISQALIYHQVRKYLLRLDPRKTHSKFWRPSILLLTNDTISSDVKLCHCLKKGGLYIIGQLIVGELTTANQVLQEEICGRWLDMIKALSLKAIPQVVITSNLCEGYRILMQTAGLGGMQTNTIIFPLDQQYLGITSYLDYANLLVHVSVLKKNLVVLANTNHLDRRLFPKQSSKYQSHKLHLFQNKEEGYSCLIDGSYTDGNDDYVESAVTGVRGVETIDVFLASGLNVSGATEALNSPPSLASTAAFMLQLAYVLHRNKRWKPRTKIRLLKICAMEFSDYEHIKRERELLSQFAEMMRITLTIDELVVIPYTSGWMTNTRTKADIDFFFEDRQTIIDLNSLLQRHTIRTAQLVLMLPNPSLATLSETAATEYVEKLQLLTYNLPSVMLVRRIDEVSVISTSI